MTNIGDLQIMAFLNTELLAKGIQNAIDMLKSLEQSGVKVGSNVDFSKIQSDIQRLLTENTRLQSEFRSTVDSENALTGASESAAGGLNKQSESARNAADGLRSTQTSTDSNVRSTNDLTSALAKAGLAWQFFLTAKESLVKLKHEFIDAGLDAAVLSANFQGTARDIELFRQATQNTLSESVLMRLSNQATDLGVNLSKQPVFFALAKLAADKYLTDTEQGFYKVILAAEGNTKGLKTLGIQKQVFNQLVEKSIELYNKQNDVAAKRITDLPIEEQKTILLNAVLDASGIKLDTLGDRSKTARDKLKEFSVAEDEARERAGKLIGEGLVKLIESLGLTKKSAVETAGVVSAMGRGFMDIIPILGVFQQAIGYTFRDISKSAVVSAGVWGAALAALVGHILNAKFAFDQVSQAFSNYKRTLGGQLYGLDQTDSEENAKNENSWFDKYKNIYNLGKGQLQILRDDEVKRGIDVVRNEDYLSRQIKRLRDRSVTEIGDTRAATNKEIKSLEDELEKLQNLGLPKELSRRSGTHKTPEDPVEKQIESWRELIDVYNYVSQARGKSETSVMSEIVNLEKGTSLTDKQRVSLRKFYEEIEELSKKPKLTLIPVDFKSDELKKQVEADVQMIYDEWKKAALKEDGTLKRNYNPFNYYETFRTALELRKRQMADDLTINDLETINLTIAKAINDIKEKNVVDGKLDIKNLQDVTLLEKEILKNEDEILKIRKQASDALIDAQSKRVALYDDEFLRRRAQVEMDFRKQMSELDEKEIKARTQMEINALRSQRNLIRAERLKSLKDIDSEEDQFNTDKVFDTFDSSVSKAQQIARLFGEGGNKVVESFQRALDYARTIRDLFDMGKSLFNLITSFATGGASSALPIFHDGTASLPGSGDVPIIAEAGEAIIARRRVESLSSMFGPAFVPWLIGHRNSGQTIFHNGGFVPRASGTTTVKEVPYVASTKIQGRDIKLVLTRYDRVEGRRIG